ncbi:RNA polymerase sigma factor FliA [Candidatus Burarchaeum australiense]|nr:RNA polymerase sigma factor FliA [Candidatus Burarchaeum australiense]
MAPQHRRAISSVAVEKPTAVKVSSPLDPQRLANGLLRDGPESKAIETIATGISDASKATPVNSDFEKFWNLVSKRVRVVAIRLARNLYPEQKHLSWEDLFHVAFEPLRKDFEVHPSKWCDPSLPPSYLINRAGQIARNKIIDHLRTIVDRHTHALREANLKLQDMGLPLTAKNLSKVLGYEVSESDVIRCIPRGSLDRPLGDDEMAATVKDLVRSPMPGPTDSSIPTNPEISMMQDLERALPHAGLTPTETVILALRFGNPQILGAMEALQKLKEGNKRSAPGSKPITPAQFKRIGITLRSQAELADMGIIQKYLSLKKIGELLGISESRTCQLEGRAMKKFQTVVEAYGGVIWRPAKVNI